MPDACVAAPPFGAPLKEQTLASDFSMPDIGAVCCRAPVASLVFPKGAIAPAPSPDPTATKALVGPMFWNPPGGAVPTLRLSSEMAFRVTLNRVSDPKYGFGRALTAERPAALEQRRKKLAIARGVFMAKPPRLRNKCG
jgi:hypothetical protein